MTMYVTQNPDRTTLPPLITSEVAAQLVAGSTRKITDMCKRGEIKAVKLGHDWRINTAAFLEQFGI